MSPAEFVADFLVRAIQDAIAGKPSKEELLNIVKDAMVAASDAEMHRELDGDGS